MQSYDTINLTLLQSIKVQAYNKINSYVFVSTLHNFVYPLEILHYILQCILPF